MAKNHLVMTLGIIAGLASLDMVADAADDINNAAVVMLAPPVSAIKAQNMITTPQGDVTIEPSDKIEYEVTFQIGRGPFQKLKYPGYHLANKLKEMEAVANQKKFVFTIHSIIKLDKRHK